MRQAIRIVCVCLVRCPIERGFGMTLIERGFAHELSGHATLDFDLDGVRATLRAPIGAAISVGQASEKLAAAT